MKKLIFAVLVVLLAILAVTCDSAIFPATGGGEPGTVGPVEPGLVTLDINVAESRARALVDSAAAGDTDFYEVVFVSPSNKTYRQTFNKTTNANGDGTSGNVFRISVPEGNYSNSGNAGDGTVILFAGKNNGSDKTLLGAGEITAISTSGGPATTGTTIASTTTAITISVYPLTAAVTSGAASSVTITGATITPLTITGAGYSAYAIVTNSALTATYKIAAASTMTNNVSSRVNIATGSATIASAATPEGVLPATSGTPVTSIAPNSGTLAAALTSGFTISFTSSATDTWSKLWMQVQVTTVSNGITGLNGSGVPAGTWYLRGGINNTDVDPDTGGKGGAVLLKVGNPETLVDVIINVTP